MDSKTIRQPVKQTPNTGGTGTRAALRLITFDDGKCDFNANGFDCRDCPLMDNCDNAETF